MVSIMVVVGGGSRDDVGGVEVREVVGCRDLAYLIRQRHPTANSGVEGLFLSAPYISESLDGIKTKFGRRKSTTSDGAERSKKGRHHWCFGPQVERVRMINSSSGVIHHPLLAWRTIGEFARWWYSRLRP